MASPLYGSGLRLMGLRPPRGQGRGLRPAPDHSARRAGLPGGKVWEPSHLPLLLRHAYAWRPYPRYHCWFRFSLSSGSTVLQ